LGAGAGLVVDVFTARTETPAPQPDVQSFTEEQAAAAQSGSASTRRLGPGRPRSKRRMEPFSSKIEIELRDEMDAYVDANGLSIIDFLDEAIRDPLKK
jgi:hypothetical protein